MKTDPNNIIDYKYEHFIEGIDEIAKQIIDSGFDPDYLVGIARGGCVPGTYLSHRLKKPIVMVHWNTRDGGSPNGNESNLWIPDDIVDNNMKVIVIDDIVDGGETIRQLLNDWQSSTFKELRKENIRIAAMYYNIAQDITVDFYHRTIDRDVDKRWVIFPWEA